MFLFEKKNNNFKMYINNKNNKKYIYIITNSLYLYKRLFHSYNYYN